MSKNNIKPVSRKSGIVVQDFDNEILIYDLTENKAFSLNETSAMIWQSCDGKKSVSEIARIASKKFNSAITEDFVWLALEQLKKDNLLENASEVSTDFGGLSRREVIRKVGFASLVSLPVVASLVAPMAIHAQSGCFGNNGNRQSANGCTCNSASDCVNNCCASSPNPRTCVSRKATGPCGNVCECISDCCANNSCSARTVGAGGSCIKDCQCTSTSLTCQNGVCASPPIP